MAQFDLSILSQAQTSDFSSPCIQCLSCGRILLLSSLKNHRNHCALYLKMQMSKPITNMIASTREKSANSSKKQIYPPRTEKRKANTRRTSSKSSTKRRPPRTKQEVKQEPQPMFTGKDLTLQPSASTVEALQHYTALCEDVHLPLGERLRKVLSNPPKDVKLKPIRFRRTRSGSPKREYSLGIH
ncbi:hypothetical protein P9112_008599 [Eukaryota sp. TZLM1-RC]